MGRTAELQALARLSRLAHGKPTLGLLCLALWGPAAWAQTTKPVTVAAATSANTGAPPTSAAGPANTAAKSARPTVSCLIGPEVVADLGTPVTGLVASVAVDRGDAVRAGQTLVQLESEVERNNLEAARSRAKTDADVRAAEANLALARQRHIRASELVAQGFASSQALEQAQAEHEVAEQRLQQARSQKAVNAHELGLVQAQLNQRTLRSPFSGVVIERYVSPGERAEDKPLLRLAMLDPLRVELVMPATRWGTVSVGDSLPIVPELPGASSLIAQISHIDKIIDAASNTFRVRLALANPGHRIPAGARCRSEGTAVAGTVTPAAGATHTPAVGGAKPAAVSPAGFSQLPASRPSMPTAPALPRT